jgi:hypothetical protein
MSSQIRRITPFLVFTALNNREFGIWMMENAELLISISEELQEAGRWLPETSKDNIIVNSLVLRAEFERRYPERNPEVIDAVVN